MGAQMSEQEVTFPCGDATLAGVLAIPANAKAMVVFAHGSGSNHRSSRNADTARQLYDAGFASLRADLLTSEEAELNERTGQYRFDVAMLSERVLAASMFVGTVLAAQMLPLAYFGASTGAAAALTAAASLGARVGAVISRGGRPDLAVDLPLVTAPTLLIVGGAECADDGHRHESVVDVVVTHERGHDHVVAPRERRARQRRRDVTRVVATHRGRRQRGRGREALAVGVVHPDDRASSVFGTEEPGLGVEVLLH